MASEAASVVLVAARALYATVQQVKANKRQARLLSDRVLAIVDPVRAFDAARLAKAETQTALAVLLAVIQDAVAFVDDFRDTGRLRRVIFKTGHAERFAELNTRLSNAAQAMTLGAVLSLHFGSAEDARAQALDSIQDKKLLGIWAIAPVIASFVGREHELASLEALLKPTAVRVAAARIAISGMGGTGKSTLAQWAAQRHADRFSSGWVLDGSNVASLQAGLRQVAADLDLEAVSLDQIPRVVRARLSQPDRTGWLLIVDNVDDAVFAKGLLGLLPTLGGCVLVTSRLAHWDRDEWAVVPLAAMPTAEALQVLQDMDDAAARSVAGLLGGLPLALAQARTVVRRTRIGWTAYLDTLRTHTAAALGDAMPSLRLSLQAAVHEAPACAVLLQMLQALHPDDVPRSILADAYRRATGSADASAPLTVLADLSIVTLTADFVSTHRLMQEAMRDSVPLPAAAVLHLAEAMNAAVSSRSTSVNDANPQLSAALVFHYPVLLGTLERSHAGTREHADALFGYLNTVIQPNGGPVMTVVRQCADLYDRHVSDDDITKAPVFFMLAVSLGVCGAHAEGMAMSKRFLAAAERNYPSNLAFLGFAQYCVGNTLLYMAEYKESRQYLDLGMANISRALGPNHWQVAIIVFVHGSALSHVGEYQLQLDVCAPAVDVLRRHFNKDNNIYLLHAYRCVGDSLCELGDLARGLPMLESAQASIDEAFGKNKVTTHIVRACVAKAYGRCGQYAKQVQALQDALDFYTASEDFGPSHRTTLMCQVRMGDAHGALGDARKQLELISDALPNLEVNFPAGHIELARAHAGLGEAHSVLGDTARGGVLLADALAVFEGFFGPDHVETARVRTRLARGHLAAGSFGLARSQLQSALAVQEGFFKDGHGDIAQTLAALAQVHAAAGDRAAQRACLERALALFERHYGADHAMTALARQELAPPATADSPSCPASESSPAAAATAAAPVDKWTVADVVAWLRGLDLSDLDEAVTVVERERLRGRHLRLLTEERLARYGVRGGDTLTLLEERDRLLSVVP